MARKKKKKLKKSVKLTVILILLLVFGIKYLKPEKIVEKKVINKTQELLKKKSVYFLKNIWKFLKVSVIICNGSFPPSGICPV